MVKATKAEVTRGPWKRNTIRINSNLTLNDLLAAKSTEEASQLLGPFIKELQKTDPPGATPRVRTRARYARLLQVAVCIFEREGYPSEPGWYHRVENKWIKLRKKDYERRIRAGERVARFLWPHFDDIEELSRADIARNLIIKINEFLRVYNLCSKSGRRAKSQSTREPRPAVPSYVALANAAFEVIVAYATFKAEASNMAQHADTGLKTREGAAKGGKAKGTAYGNQKELQEAANAIWKKTPHLSKNAVAGQIHRSMLKGVDRDFLLPRVGTIAKRIVRPGQKTPR